MPATLGTVIKEVRTMLDEKTPRFWDNDDLATWINEGARDIARRTETLEALIQFEAIYTQPTYPLPMDTLRVHRVEFQNVVQNAMPITYPLEMRSINEMDQIWGSMQYQQRAYPTFVTFFGAPPNIVMRLFPVPSQAGWLNVYYYQLPAPAYVLTDIIRVPEGWYDLLARYCEFQAMRKDRDQRWQEAKQLYEEGALQLIDMSRRHHDQMSQFVYSARPGGAFPYGWGDW